MKIGVDSGLANPDFQGAEIRKSDLKQCTAVSVIRKVMFFHTIICEVVKDERE